MEIVYKENGIEKSLKGIRADHFLKKYQKLDGVYSFPNRIKEIKIKNNLFKNQEYKFHGECENTIILENCTFLSSDVEIEYFAKVICQYPNAINKTRISIIDDEVQVFLYQIKAPIDFYIASHTAYIRGNGKNVHMKLINQSEVVLNSTHDLDAEIHMNSSTKIQNIRNCNIHGVIRNMDVKNSTIISNKGFEVPSSLKLNKSLIESFGAIVLPTGKILPQKATGKVQIKDDFVCVSNKIREEENEYGILIQNSQRYQALLALLSVFKTLSTRYQENYIQKLQEQVTREIERKILEYQKAIEDLERKIQTEQTYLGKTRNSIERSVQKTPLKKF